MKLRFDKRLEQRGMALLMVIGVVSLLVVIVMNLRISSEASWDEKTLSKMRFQAHLLAESGANLALHPDIENGDPALTKDFGDGRSFAVTIKTEGGRILVNNLADDATLEGVTELFIRWGLDATNAAIAAESLADWIDEDGEARNNGAEQAFYASLDHPEFPTNDSFSNLETMLLARGMDEVARAQPLWRDYFTIYGDGMIDLNSAAPEIIEAFMEVTPNAAVNFATARLGSDGIEGTADDEIITDTGQAQQLLGLSEADWSEKSALITLEGTIRRIESVGQVGDHQVRLVVLTDVSENEDELASPIAKFTD